MLLLLLLLCCRDSFQALQPRQGKRAGNEDRAVHVRGGSARSQPSSQAPFLIRPGQQQHRTATGSLCLLARGCSVLLSGVTWQLQMTTLPSDMPRSARVQSSGMGST